MAYFGGDDYYSRVSPKFDHNNREGPLTNIFTLHDTLVNGTSEALSGLFLVAIVSCAVEEAVAYSECGFDGLFGQGQQVLARVDGYLYFLSLTSAQVARST